MAASNSAVKAQTVNLRGKEYVMVAGRVLIAHQDNPENLGIDTDIIFEDDKLVRVKARVTTRKGTFTGMAESDKKSGQGVEKESPLEVAETSAIGRALGFAGYAVENGIASAEEMHEAERRKTTRAPQVAAEPKAVEAGVKAISDVPGLKPMCAKCNKEIEPYPSNAGTLTPQEIAERTLKSHGQQMCVPCTRIVGSPRAK